MILKKLTSRRFRSNALWWARFSACVNDIKKKMEMWLAASEGMQTNFKLHTCEKYWLPDERDLPSAPNSSSFK